MNALKESNFRIKRDFGISDVLVDFLGALFPGLLFSVAIVLTLGSSFSYLIHQLKVIILEMNYGIENIDTFGLFQYFSKGFGSFSFYFLMLILIASYVLGQFLYRKDPKDPDTASFRRVWKKMNKEQQNKWVEQVKSDENISSFIVEFPYRFLKNYLDARGLPHLSKIIPWDENNFSTRSKTFINQLKIRINFFYPDKMGDILKNEGHVRLMSSIWHLLKYLKILSVSCLISNILIFISGLIWTNKTVLFLLIPSFFSLMIYFLGSIGKTVIESFIHYQRVREVFYVLETAYTASIENKEILTNIDYPELEHTS